MANEYRVRQLTIADKSALEGLIDNVEATIKEKAYWLPITNESRAHFFDRNWTIMWGIFDDDRLIGSIGLFLNKNEYGESQKQVQLEDKKIAEAGRVMCHTEYRGKGVATLLMAELIKYSKTLDLDFLLSTVHPQNEPSQRLVKKFGFKKVGSIIKSKSYERDILTKEI